MYGLYAHFVANDFMWIELHNIANILYFSARVAATPIFNCVRMTGRYEPATFQLASVSIWLQKVAHGLI
jgi:hypothetical protein